MTLAVILAAGNSQRFGGDKCFEYLGGKPVWRWSYDTFEAHREIDAVGVVTRSDRIEEVSIQIPNAAFVIRGGESRYESVRAAILSSDAKMDTILIHDGARPFVSAKIISDVLAGCHSNGAAYPAISPVDAIRKGNVMLDRAELFCAQTPQAASRAAFQKAYAAPEMTASDDIEVLAASGVEFVAVSGSPENFKITHSSDFQRAEAILGTEEFRTGTGYDIHRFSTDQSRKCVLGGVEFQNAPGLEGHSDADVLIHAICDALFGAAGLPDIGCYFPNTDPKWKNTASTEFLIFAKTLLTNAGWRIVNIDSTILAEIPKIMGHQGAMRANIAQALGIEAHRIGVKATTHEKLGAIGRSEGVAAMAVATLAKRNGGR